MSGATQHNVAILFPDCVSLGPFAGGVNPLTPKEPGHVSPAPSVLRENLADRRFHICNLTEAVHFVQHVLGVVIPDERRRFLIIFHQSRAQTVLIVVRPALEI